MISPKGFMHKRPPPGPPILPPRFPRNVSDIAAHDALHICHEGASPLQPTIPPKPQATKAGWLAKNWLSLLVGALGGALLATGVGATLFFSKNKSANPGPDANDRSYTAM